MCLYSLEPQTSSKTGTRQHQPLARGQRFGVAMDQQMIRPMQHSGSPSYSASHHSHHSQNVAKPTHSVTTSSQQMEMQQKLGPSVGYVPQMPPQMPQLMLPPGYVPQMSLHVPPHMPPHMQSHMIARGYAPQQQEQETQQQQQQQQHDIQLMKNNCTTYNQRPQQHRKRPQPPQLQVRMGGNPMIYANEHQRYTHGIEVGANETNRHSSLLLPTQTTPISIVASSSPLHPGHLATESISHTKTNKRQRTLPPKETDLQQHQQHMQRQQQSQLHQLIQQQQHHQQQLHQQLQQVQRKTEPQVEQQQTRPIASATSNSLSAVIEPFVNQQKPTPTDVVGPDTEDKQ